MLLLLAACSQSVELDPKESTVTDGSTSTSAPDGDYSGTVEGLYEWPGGEEDCLGEATLSIDATGAFSGNASCTSTTWGLLEGPLEGTVSEGTVAGTWTVYFYPENVAQELTGTAIEGSFDVSTSYTNTYGSFSSNIILNRP